MTDDERATIEHPDYGVETLVDAQINEHPRATHPPIRGRSRSPSSTALPTTGC